MRTALTPHIRRRLLWAAGFCAVLLGLYLSRRPIAGLTLSAVLHDAGAGEVSFQVVEVTPWRMVLTDVGFRLRTQRFDTRRVTFVRRHWWSPSLGRVEVEGLRVPLAIDGSDINPWAWSAYASSTEAISAPAAVQLPFEQVQVRGQLLLQAAAMPDRPVDLDFHIKRQKGAAWQTVLHAGAPGLSMQGSGHYDPARDRLEFQVSDASLDLALWQEVVRHLVILPGGPWEMAGRLSGRAEGFYAGRNRAASGKVRLVEARLHNPVRRVTLDSISADLEFSDLLNFRSRPGSMRVSELRSGDFVLNDLELTLAFQGSDRVAVSRAVMGAFGGKLSVEPFVFTPSQQELETVLVAEAIDVERVLAATHDVPGRATGRVDGRVPVRLDSGGLRFGTGWLELRKGVLAEIQFNAAGLLTGGMSPGGAGYAVMKRIESGLLKLRINELRLDLRPPGGPPGRTATLHVTGEPTDPGIKAPITLDVNINGPLEQLINFGVDSRLRFNSSR